MRRNGFFRPPTQDTESCGVPRKGPFRTRMMPRLLPLGLVSLLLALGPVVAGAVDWWALAATLTRILLIG
jgi:hypothetical protein